MHSKFASSMISGRTFQLRFRHDKGVVFYTVAIGLTATRNIVKSRRLWDEKEKA